jgi:DNA-binding winged helix-turn-helix (wHTH) protein
MIYDFGTGAFDDEHGEVQRAGEGVRLEPQGLTVLQYLLAHREGLVSRDELLEQCWSESYVSDGALSRCLSRLRHALGHDRPRLADHRDGASARVLLCGPGARDSRASRPRAGVQ